MPRSFLVKKPSSHKIPDYGQLESWRGSCVVQNYHPGSIEASRAGGISNSPISDRDPAAVICALKLVNITFNHDVSDAPGYSNGERSAGSFWKEPTAPDCSGTNWDRSSVITRISLDMGAKEAFRCNPPIPEISLDTSLQYQARLTPLTDTLNNLNLPSAMIPKNRHQLDCSGGSACELTEAQNISARGPLESFDCFDCQRSYHSVSGLAKPRQLHCELYSRKNFSCKFCEKEYSSLGALKMHIRTHTLPCVCRICSKAFSRPWLLQGHIRTHTGEKPFACPHCSRAFADRSNLRAHLQTHSDIKKYQCSGCFKTFSRISLLSKHQDTGCSPLPPLSPLSAAQNKGLEPGMTTCTALEQRLPIVE